MKNVLGKLIGADRRGYRRISRLGSTSPNEWIRKSSQIDGWLFEGEHELLWELAETSLTSNPHANFLEVGSWMGKSACILAGACATYSPGNCVFCIDPFTMMGAPEQEAYHHRLLGKADGTFYYFVKNARRLGFDPWIVPLATISERVLPRIRPPMSLAFVDASHDYVGVKSDSERVLPHLVKGGYLLLHDATVYDGVAKYVSELEADARLKLCRRVNSMVAFQVIEQRVAPSPVA